MCGIAGELRFNGDADAALINEITSTMINRGPDGCGLVAFDNMAFGQRRLRIFDLSPKGQQPIFDPELGLCMVFNGAIYNYQELRAELENKGYKFFSTSDTEVLIKAYHAWGLDMLKKLQGMFAFVIWERDSGKLIMARDRLGVKPFYYIHNQDFFRFASTLPALLKGDIDRSIDPVALHYYLMFHATPEPFTLIKNIRKLEPGCALVLHPDGRSETKRYWQLTFDSTKVVKNKSENEWLEMLETTLTAAIKRRLIADVPVGVLLSGGLDSSLLVALIAKITNQVPQTFAIGFESTFEEKGDEFYYSDMVAKHFSTNHRQIFIKNTDMLAELGNCVGAMSEPMTSHDNIGFYLLSREVAKYVKVVQSGQGADEIFAGYSWFQKLQNQSAPNDQAAQIMLENLADRSYSEYQEIVNSPTQNYARDYMEQLCGRSNSDSLLDHALTYESNFALSSGPLARVDNMMMAWGLEGRVPFLDHELAELAAQMPLEMKMRDGGKYILKKLARDLLPSEVIDRPKGYFPVPALKHMSPKEIDWMKEILSPENIKKSGLFKQNYIDELLANPAAHKTHAGASKLWQIVVLEYWLQINKIN